MTYEETALKDWLSLTRVLIRGKKAIRPTWHSRGWEWDARKEEMANDSIAARRLVSLTGKE